jgi:hypothetical protein
MIFIPSCDKSSPQASGSPPKQLLPICIVPQKLNASKPILISTCNAVSWAEARVRKGDLFVEKAVTMNESCFLLRNLYLYGTKDAFTDLAMCVTIKLCAWTLVHTDLRLLAFICA